jgi:hypothetical protein
MKGDAFPPSELDSFVGSMFMRTPIDRVTSPGSQNLLFLPSLGHLAEVRPRRFTLKLASACISQVRIASIRKRRPPLLELNPEQFQNDPEPIQTNSGQFSGTATQVGVLWQFGDAQFHVRLVVCPRQFRGLVAFCFVIKCYFLSHLSPCASDHAGGVNDSVWLPARNGAERPMGSEVMFDDFFQFQFPPNSKLMLLHCCGD